MEYLLGLTSEVYFTKIMFDTNFESKVTLSEREAWISFKQVETNFVYNKKS